MDLWDVLKILWVFIGFFIVFAIYYIRHYPPSNGDFDFDE